MNIEQRLAIAKSVRRNREKVLRQALSAERASHRTALLVQVTRRYMAEGEARTARADFERLKRLHIGWSGVSL